MRPETLPLAVLQPARLLHASGISQAISASACDAVFAAFAIARAAGAIIMYDPNVRLKLWPLARAKAIVAASMAQCTWCLPSQDDAQVLFEGAAPDAVVDAIHRAGAPGVVLKLGARGCLVSDGARRELVAAHVVRSVDATGAGDCFDGAFATRLLAGDDPFAAARYANAGAALATTGYGAVAPAAARRRRRPISRRSRDDVTAATFRPDLFEGKVALVVGGTTGIGAGVAQAFAALGAMVTVTGATVEECTAARAASDFRCHDAVAVDVRDHAAVTRLVDKLPRLDLLVNCAGIIRRGAEHDVAVFEEVLAINLTGTMRTCTTARDKLKAAGGAIVNTASVLSFFGGGLVPGYAASKVEWRSSRSRSPSRMQPTAFASTRWRRAGSTHLSPRRCARTRSAMPRSSAAHRSAAGRSFRHRRRGSFPVLAGSALHHRAVLPVDGGYMIA